MKEAQHCPHFSDEFVGSAVVVGATFDREHTTLRLRTFADYCLDYAIDGIPDPDAFAALMANTRRPISVKIRGRAGKCTVVTLGAGGARHADVAQGTALALIRSGVHAVVEGGMQSRLPCSARFSTAPAP